MPLLNNYLIVGAVLFGIGLVGFLSRRNMIVMFLAVEIMLQGVSLSLVAWGRFHNNFDGQMLVVFIIAVAACEAAVALALVLMLFHRHGNLDIADWHMLRESNQPAFAEKPLPEMPAVIEAPPAHLTPAGVAPNIPPEAVEYRDQV
jgi:NADH-quinone oxidoreductase subunit K